MIKFKNAITPVIGVSLLLVVSVLAVVGFQGWFNNFSSELFVNAEQDSDKSSNGELIQDLVGEILYVNSPSENFTINDIELGGVNCNISTTLTKKGINKIEVGPCLSKINTVTPDIVLFSDKKIETKTIYYDEDVSKFSNDCELDGTEVLNGSSYNFYNSVGAFGCSSESRSCNDKILGGNSSYMFSSCVEYIPGYSLISNCIDLQNISANLTDNYQLANNLNCGITSSWNSGLGFEPIGNISQTIFDGDFTGNGFVISNLFINRPSQDKVGLFSVIFDSNINNVVLENVDITGNNSVGGLTGDGGNLNLTQISVSGVVKGLNSVGGLVGGAFFGGGGEEGE